LSAPVISVHNVTQLIVSVLALFVMFVLTNVYEFSNMEQELKLTLTYLSSAFDAVGCMICMACSQENVLLQRFP